MWQKTGTIVSSTGRCSPTFERSQIQVPELTQDAILGGDVVL